MNVDKEQNSHQNHDAIKRGQNRRGAGMGILSSIEDNKPHHPKTLQLASRPQSKISTQHAIPMPSRAPPERQLSKHGASKEGTMQKTAPSSTSIFNVYVMSIIKFPKWVIQAITTSQRAHFFWGNLGNIHKHHLATWGLVPRKNDFGGLGVPNLREFNMSL